MTPEKLVADLMQLLDVEQTGPDLFQGPRKIGGVGRVFGGQVIAQALVAAERTVAEDRAPHSLHAYFLRGGSEDHPVDYAIARDFDGGSFSNRRVVASQQGKPILNFTASFQQKESGVQHAEPMPDVPGPDELESEASLKLRLTDMIPEAVRAFVMQPKALDVRPVDPMNWIGRTKGQARLETWFRISAQLPDDPTIHRAILAYTSDYTLLGTSTVPHGLSWIAGDVIGASLDHAVWFHDDFRADEWLLYTTDSPWAGHGRGFNRGKIYTQDGRLVAETAQEGLIRVRDQSKTK